MTDLLLFPYGGNAKEALGAIEAINKIQKTWNVVGFIDDNASKKGEEFLGVKVLGSREFLSQHKQAKVLAIPGHPKTFLNRKDVINSLEISKDRFATIIHPAANISSDVEVGFNTLILPGVFACGDVVIGNHCMIRPNTVVSHNAIIADYCLVGSNVSISGGVKFGELCYVGPGCVFKQEIEIGEGTMIGMAAVVMENVPANSVFRCRRESY